MKHALALAALTLALTTAAYAVDCHSHTDAYGDTVTHCDNVPGDSASDLPPLDRPLPGGDPTRDRLPREPEPSYDHVTTMPRVNTDPLSSDNPHESCWDTPYGRECE